MSASCQSHRKSVSTEFCGANKCRKNVDSAAPEENNQPENLNRAEPYRKKNRSVKTAEFEHELKMSSLVGGVLATLNGVGSAISSTVLTFLTVNYVVGEQVAEFSTATLKLLWSALASVARGLEAALEDLAVFLADTADSLSAAADLAGSLSDSAVASVSSSLAAVASCISGAALAVAGGAAQFGEVAAGALRGVGALLVLAWSSAGFVLGLIPASLNLAWGSLKTATETAADLAVAGLAQGGGALVEAPLETVLGAIAVTTAGVALNKLVSAQRLATGRDLVCSWWCQRMRPSLRRLAVQTFQVSFFVYLSLIRVLIFSSHCVVRFVVVTLSHLHVARFHHSGDSSSDAEDAGLVVLRRSSSGRPQPGGYDDESGEDERAADRRRNYDLLVKRRSERQRLKRMKQQRPQRCQGLGYNDDDDEDDENDDVGDDVEELLFEQVEREREDKLCVICQDREKCIMILPCRHLCVCTDCCQPLLRHNNSCPICRRPCQQTIKAFL